MKYIVLFLGLVVSQFSFGQNYPETIPDFRIFTLEGNSFSQDQIKENTYSYIIYFSPTCSHCVDAFKLLNIKAGQIKDADVQIYPVSSNTKEITVKFFEDHAPNIEKLDNTHILIDDNYKVADVFMVSGFPTGYLYDQDKKLVKVFENSNELILFLNDIK